MYMIHKYTYRQNTVHIKLKSTAQDVRSELRGHIQKSGMENTVGFQCSVMNNSVGLVGYFHRLLCVVFI